MRETVFTNSKVSVPVLVIPELEEDAVAPHLAKQAETPHLPPHMHLLAIRRTLGLSSQYDNAIALEALRSRCRWLYDCKVNRFCQESDGWFVEAPWSQEGADWLRPQLHQDRERTPCHLSAEFRVSECLIAPVMHLLNEREDGPHIAPFTLPGRLHAEMLAPLIPFTTQQALEALTRFDGETRPAAAYLGTTFSLLRYWIAKNPYGEVPTRSQVGKGYWRTQRKTIMKRLRGDAMRERRALDRERWAKELEEWFKDPDATVAGWAKATGITRAAASKRVKAAGFQRPEKPEHPLDITLYDPQNHRSTSWWAVSRGLDPSPATKLSTRQLLEAAGLTCVKRGQKWVWIRPEEMTAEDAELLLANGVKTA